MLQMRINVGHNLGTTEDEISGKRAQKRRLAKQLEFLPSLLEVCQRADALSSRDVDAQLTRESLPLSRPSILNVSRPFVCTTWVQLRGEKRWSNEPQATPCYAVRFFIFMVHSPKVAGANLTVATCSTITSSLTPSKWRADVFPKRPYCGD